MLNTTITLLLYYFSILSVGWFLVSYFFSFPFYLKLALTYGFGSAVIAGELFFYFFIFRFPISFWLYLALFAQANLALLLSWYYFKRRQRIVPVKKQPWTILEKIITSFIVVIFLFSLANAITRPPLAYDAMTIWSLRAKILLRDGRIDFNPESYTYLNSPHYRSYPWQVSLSEYWLRQLGGNETAVNILPFGYYICLSLLLYYGTTCFVSRLRSLFLVLIYSSMPLIFYHSFTTYADLTLAYYVTAGAVFLLLWLIKQDRLFLFFSAIFMGWTLFVKNEGIFYIIGWCLALLVGYLLKQVNLSRKIIIYTLGSLVLPITAWLVFRVIYHLELSDSLLVISWHPQVFMTIIQTLFIDNSWNIWWFIFVLGILIKYNAIWRNRRFWPFWIFCLAAGGSFIVLYFFTQRAEHALNFTAIARTFIPLVSLSILAFSLALSDKDPEISVKHI